MTHREKEIDLAAINHIDAMGDFVTNKPLAKTWFTLGAIWADRNGYTSKLRILEDQIVQLREELKNKLKSS